MHILLPLIILAVSVESSKDLRYLEKEPCFGKDCDAHKKHRDKHKPDDHHDWFDDEQFNKPTKEPPQDDDCIDCFDPPYPNPYPDPAYQYEENGNDILSLKGGLRRKFAFEALRKKKHHSYEDYYYSDKDESLSLSDSDSSYTEEYYEEYHKHKQKKQHENNKKPVKSSSVTTFDSEEYDTEKHKHQKKKKSKKHEQEYEGKEGGILSLSGVLRQRLAYECMAELNGQSSVCSPLSALKPLGMLAFGAEGRTLSEILRGIGLISKSEVKKHFKNILKGMTLRTSGLHMASRIYIEDTLRLRSTFKKEAEEVFGSCIEQVNFKDRSRVAYEVNSWVDYHTNKKISSIINPSDVLPHPIGFIVDAIYFWGRWKYPFRQMRSETFHGTLGARSATMMCNTRNYNYGYSNELEAQVIEIPYQDREMKLIILLPRSMKGLESLIKRLKQSPELINNVEMKDTKIQLQLPKFKIETSLNLKNVYQRTGLKEMFEPNQGLTKVVNADNAIYVDMAIQKAFLVLDQEGTEAGGSMIGAGTGGKRSTPFVANHPFMFFITLRKEQLFAGVLQ